MTDRLKKIFDSGKLRRIIIISGIAGIALIFISNFINAGELRGSERDDRFSVSEYSKQIESDLETLITHIDGAGATKVMSALSSFSFQPPVSHAIDAVTSPERKRFISSSPPPQ